MALIHLNFESQYLGSNTDVNIIMPDKPRDKTIKQFYDSNKKYKVLCLLHGTFGDYSDWLRKSNIETYALEKDLVVVMPSCGNSDYSQWNNFTLGYDAEKYVMEELMPLVYNWLPVSSKREDNYIAGLSMGGKGTLTLALKYPHKFNSAAVLSYVPSDLNLTKEESKKLYDMPFEQVLNNSNDIMHGMLRQYNVMHKYNSFDEYMHSDYNVWDLCSKADPSLLPNLFIACGSDDVLFAKQFPVFKQYLQSLNIQASYSFKPGNHEWRVWERDIQQAIDFFALDKDIKGNMF